MLALNRFHPSVLTLLCALLAGAAQAQDVASRPIENYISPPQLFPSEGAVLRAPYAPMPAYDRPFGKVIGEVGAVLGQCPERQGWEVCGSPRAWYLALRGGHRVELHHEMVGYEQESLVSYRTAVRAGETSWSHIEFAGGAFWIKTPATDVSSYESNARWIQDFDTWCSTPGQCKPVAAVMRKEMGRMLAGEFRLGSPGPQTYRIDGLVTQGGRRYYKVSRTEVQAGTPQPDVPATGYIPTRRKNGGHVGEFSPKGC